jgi:hypothetical protein
MEFRASVRIAARQVAADVTRVANLERQGSALSANRNEGISRRGAPLRTAARRYKMT